MKSLSLSRSAVIAASAALAAIGSVGIAHAISSNIFQYNTPHTGYLSLSPYAFAPGTSATASNYSMGSKLAVAQPGCFVSNVILPDGAQIKGFTSWSSGQTGGSVAVTLQRTNVSTGQSSAIADASLQNSSGTRTATNGTVGPGSVINNQHYVYELLVCLADSNSFFYSARIPYTYTNAGD